MVKITINKFQFIAKFITDKAPLTCSAFEKILPFSSKLIQARWSGEAGWIPMGDFDLGVGSENVTCYPGIGDILFYPTGLSETEILFVYGYSSFASKAGPLAGNHFLKITEGIEYLEKLGHIILWSGAQNILFEQENEK